MILDCSNQIKYEKVIQNGLQWETQNPPQIAENQFWSRLNAPVHPNDHPDNEKVVSQDPECLKTGPPRPRKINKPVKQNK